MKRKLDFELEDGARWYVVLPDYPGDKADLQMVAGADDMLFMLDGTMSGHVTLEVSDTEELGQVLNLKQVEEVGATYIWPETTWTHPTKLFGDLVFTRAEKEIWLCPVLEYLFGEYPSRIYFNMIEDEIYRKV